jgi:hypothetical protein
VLLSVCVLALALTHYFSLGTIVALAIFAAARLRGRALRAVAGSFAAAAVVWMVLGAPLALRHSANLNDKRATDFLRDDEPGHVARTAMRTAALPVRYFTEPASNSQGFAMVGAAAFILAVMLAIQRPGEMLLWCLWLWLTIAPIVALDLVRRTQHLELTRYTLLASPAMYALIASALSSSRRALMRHLAPALVTLGCLGALSGAYAAWWKADWRAFAQSMDRAARPGDVTVFYTGDAYAAYPHMAYLGTSYYRRTAWGPIVLMTRAPDETMLEQLRSAPGVLLVTATTTDPRPAFGGAALQSKGFEAGIGSVSRISWGKGPATRK